MLRLLPLLFFAIACVEAIAQVPEQDCFQAINVCTDTYVQANSYNGSGAITEIQPGQTCLANGEMNSVWYRIQVSQGGQLSFQLNPLNPNDDYDFAVFGLNGSSCSDIVSGANFPIRCNYSAQAGSTGLSAGSTITTASTGDPNQCSDLTVTAGDSYVILVSNFTSSNSGYELEFSGTASIYDQEPAQLLNIDNGGICNPEKIWLTFNEGIDCLTIESSGTDFTVIGPEPVVVDQALGINCSSDGSSNEIRLKFQNKINTVGVYQVFAQIGSDGNTLLDRCGNEIPSGLIGSFEVEFIGPEIAIQDHQDPECGSDDGWIQTVVSFGTGPFIYEWSVTSLDQESFNDSLPSGNYGITVSDANGCTEQVSQALVYLNSPELTASNIIGVECNGTNSGSATVLVTPGTFLGSLTYEWETVPPQFGPTATGLPAGDVHVNVQDGSNCSTGMIIIIPDVDPLSLNYSIEEPACNATDGAIHLTLTGGTGVYDYAWNSVPAQSTASAIGLGPGVFSCSVTDSNGCIEEIEVVLVNSSAPDAMVNETVASCGQSNGWASASALSGVAPINYEWNTSPPQLDSVATGLNPGNYFCEITDASGCVQIINVKIDSVPPPSFNAMTELADCGMDNGQIDIEMTSGVSPFSFLLGGDSTMVFSPITGLAPGTYSLVVSDSVGCEAIQDITIESAPPESDFTVSPVCVGVEAQFTMATNSQATDFNWLFGDGTGSTLQNPEHTYLQPGVYDVTLSLSGGCAPDQVVKQVEIFTPPSPAFVSSTEIILENEPFNLDYSGSPVDSVFWSFENQDHLGFSVHQAELGTEGTYPLFIEVIDENGCAAELIAELDVIKRPTLFAPNAFNPAGIGENRVFRLEGIGVTQVQFWVFDRWGKQLFEANGVNEAMTEGWDGSFNGNALPQGVYAYRIKATMITGKEFESVGTVTMLR